MKEYIDKYYGYWFAVNEFYDNWAKQHDLTVNTLFILHTLYNQQNSDQSYLCRRLFLPKQTVNSVLSGLEQNGYVVKHQRDTDRRNKVVILTESGLRYAEKILRALYTLEADALSSMTEEQRDGFIKYNELFLDGLKKSKSDG